MLLCHLKLFMTSNGHWGRIESNNMPWSHLYRHLWHELEAISRSEPIWKMAPTDEFSTNFKNDFDLGLLNTLIWGGPRRNLKTHPSTPYLANGKITLPLVPLPHDKWYLFTTPVNGLACYVKSFPVTGYTSENHDWICILKMTTAKYLDQNYERFWSSMQFKRKNPILYPLSSIISCHFRWPEVLNVDSTVIPLSFPKICKQP